MVERAQHLAGRRVGPDRLTDVAALGSHVPNWRAMLRYGLEAGGLGAEGETIEARLPLAAGEWIVAQKAATGRLLAPGKRGPKPRGTKPLSPA